MLRPALQSPPVVSAKIISLNIPAPLVASGIPVTSVVFPHSGGAQIDLKPAASSLPLFKAVGDILSAHKSGNGRVHIFSMDLENADDNTARRTLEAANIILKQFLGREDWPESAATLNLSKFLNGLPDRFIKFVTRDFIDTLNKLRIRVYVKGGCTETPDDFLLEALNTGVFFGRVVSLSEPDLAIYILDLVADSFDLKFKGDDGSLKVGAIDVFHEVKNQSPVVAERAIKHLRDLCINCGNREIELEALHSITVIARRYHGIFDAETRNALWQIVGETKDTNEHKAWEVIEALLAGTRQDTIKAKLSVLAKEDKRLHRFLSGLYSISNDNSLRKYLEEHRLADRRLIPPAVIMPDREAHWAARDLIRSDITQAALSGNGGETSGFAQLIGKYPLLRQWESLADENGEVIEVPVDEITKVLKEQTKVYYSSLGKQIEYIMQARDSHRDVRLMIALENLGFQTDPSISPPKDVEKIRPRDLFVIGECFDEMGKSNFISPAQLSTLHIVISQLLRFHYVYEAIKGHKGMVSYFVSLCNKQIDLEPNLNLQQQFYDDPAAHAIILHGPDDAAICGYKMRLVVDMSNGEPTLVYEPFTAKSTNLHLWPNLSLFDELMKGRVRKIAEKIGVKNIVAAANIERIHWSEMRFAPASTPAWIIDNAIPEILAKHEHSDRAQLSAGVGTFEAMKPLDKGRVIFSPVVAGNILLPKDFFLREIEPVPVNEQSGNYIWGFSAGMGRSVDFDRDFTTPDGTHWRHISAVGAGKTYRARGGNESRDGILPLSGAMKRFYFTNLMHHVAGPLGFRTSLGVVVVNRDMQRPNFVRGERDRRPQLQATTFELRRASLRLSDIAKAKDPAIMINRISADVASELGLTNMDSGDYVQWLAGTLGKQLAIMSIFGFDHGAEKGAPQLHFGNVSVMAEIFDFDTSGFGRKAMERYLATDFTGWLCLDLNCIDSLQRKWDEHIEEQADTAEDHTWFEIIMRMAPKINFAGILKSAYMAKIDELEKSRGSGFDLRREIKKFNENIWNPFMRNARIYHRTDGTRMRSGPTFW